MFLPRLMCVFLSAFAAAAAASASTDYADLSLEDLMKVKVTSVAGTPQARFATPAAMYVITAEDIRRSGQRSVAGALRLVPGMFVSRLNASTWVVGSRGLTASTITASRYLVMIDGRVVYDPLVSTTLWDTVDVVLEDIDRIEVIRGPGATLWGVNAVNGVVNIIMRSARDTQGTLASVGAGDNELLAEGHQGGTTKSGTAYRLWAKYDEHASFDLDDSAGGGSAYDGFSMARAGLRLDGGAPGDSWLLDADAYGAPYEHYRTSVPDPHANAVFHTVSDNAGVTGAHLLYQFNHGTPELEGWSLKTYFDRVDRDTPILSWHRNTMDADYRSWFDWAGRNELIWGLQFTSYDESMQDSPVFQFSPSRRAWQVYNAFVQNTTTLVADRLYAMAGTKLTYHDFVGLEWQPGGRIWWTPSERQTVWAAVSRPVRVPSRLEEDGDLIFSYLQTGPTTFTPIQVSHNEKLRAEKVLVYELGHRLQIGERLTLDTALFVNDYQRLISVPPSIFGMWTDAATGRSRGAEFNLNWRPLDRLRLEAAFSFIETDINGPVFKFDEKSTPRRMAQLRAGWDVRKNVELNSAVYFVDAVPFTGIDAYTRWDLGATWRPCRKLELALWGQNLQAPDHREASAVEVPRNVFGQATWRF